MPGLNRRGPNGEGAMTGKRMGRCNPDNKGKTDDEIIQNRNRITPGQGPLGNRGFRNGKNNGLGKGLGRGPAMRSGKNT